MGWDKVVTYEIVYKWDGADSANHDSFRIYAVFL